MRALTYQEASWHFALAPSLRGRDYADELRIAAFKSERDVIRATDDPSGSIGEPIELSAMIRRSDPSAPRWARRRVPVSEAERLGAELWQAVPKHIREELPLDGARLKISSDVPAVADLPWEWLSDGSGTPFALRQEFMIARSVPIKFPVHPLSVELPLRVLLLAPNPKDERLLDTTRETQALMSAWSGSNYTVSELDMPFVDELYDVLRRQEPHIVHYVGHGGLSAGEGNLILQDPGGRSRWLSATDLAALLPSSVRLLCLATPFTTDNYQVLGLPHLARASSLVNLPTTVSNQYPVSEGAVRVFWDTFYGALIDKGGNVSEAVHEARAQAAFAGPDFADWGSFTLTIRDQTGVSFEFRPADDEKRREAEFQAQFAAETANELAQQLEVLGDATPSSIRRQYEVAEKRVTRLLDDLEERA
jgi:hypothetical protein